MFTRGCQLTKARLQTALGLRSLNTKGKKAELLLRLLVDLRPLDSKDQTDAKFKLCMMEPVSEKERLAEHLRNHPHIQHIAETLCEVNLERAADFADLRKGVADGSGPNGHDGEAMEEDGGSSSSSSSSSSDSESEGPAYSSVCGDDAMRAEAAGPRVHGGVKFTTSDWLKTLVPDQVSLTHDKRQLLTTPPFSQPRIVQHN